MDKLSRATTIVQQVNCRSEQLSTGIKRDEGQRCDTHTQRAGVYHPSERKKRAHMMLSELDYKQLNILSLSKSRGLAEMNNEGQTKYCRKKTHFILLHIACCGVRLLRFVPSFRRLTKSCPLTCFTNYKIGNPSHSPHSEIPATQIRTFHTYATVAISFRHPFSLISRPILALSIKWCDMPRLPPTKIHLSAFTRCHLTNIR